MAPSESGGPGIAVRRAAAIMKTFCVVIFIINLVTTFSFRQSFFPKTHERCAEISRSIPSFKRVTIAYDKERAAIKCSASPVQEGTRSMTPGLKIFNTMSRDKELFEPRDNHGRRVKMYTCGPTVYDFAHIGNFRAFLTYDLIKRWLAYLGYDVDHVCNLTDVDDKIIQRMQRDGVTLRELTDRYSSAFLDDLRRLNILPARAYPRATEHIDAMVEMISGAAAAEM